MHAPCSYDHDMSGQIDYREFCENILGSRMSDAASVLAHKPEVSGSKRRAHVAVGGAVRCGAVQCARDGWQGRVPFIAM
jgi:hypothetical protein